MTACLGARSRAAARPERLLDGLDLEVRRTVRDTAHPPTRRRRRRPDDHHTPPAAARSATAARYVVFERTFRAPIDDVWAAVTEPERLERWIGTWTGDPALRARSSSG